MAHPTLSGNVIDFLESRGSAPLPRIIALAGPERFFHLLAVRELLGDEDDDNLTRYSSEDVEWARVLDDLSTISLFGASTRCVLIDDGDSFFKQHKDSLERYAERPTGRGTLILHFNSLPSNTRLHRFISQNGWLVECRLPARKTGRTETVDAVRMRKWLETWAKQQHRIRLRREAIDGLVQLVGWEIGLLDQELAKLALFVPADGEVTSEVVHEVVGGWRAQSNWEMLDAIHQGNAADAIRQLDYLMQSGEAPQALFGSISWSLRRFAVATRMYQHLTRQGRQANLSNCLREAGFYPNDLAKAETQLRQMTPARSGQILRWLLEADLALKGSHSAPALGRWVLERLILRLARQARPATDRAERRAASH